MSAVSWIDGKVFPWHELRDATQVPVLVDGAQSVGAIEVDATGADFYTVSGQKWLCGPDADRCALRRRSRVAAAAARRLPERGDVRHRRGDLGAEGRRAPLRHGRSRRRTRSPGLEAALSTLPAGRFERARELAERCRKLLLEHGHDVVTEAGQATLVSWRHAGDTEAAARRLYERGVIIRELPGTGLLRASVGWWNDGSDLERLAEGLEEIRLLA